MTSYEIITNEIIKKLEQGKIPWVKPWKVEGWKTPGMHPYFPAYSYSNGKRYSFLNQILLDFTPGEYATFEQIKKAGGKVKKGEHAQIVSGWIVETVEIKDKDGNVILNKDGKPETRKTFALRYYRVFNILTQVDGIEPKHEWTKDELPGNGLTPEQTAGNIIQKYITSKDAPKFEIRENEAYYSPRFDLVVVPALKQFENTAAYYSTAFHELTHSTLKESRCNRKAENKKAAFGSEEYSKEELVAELGACFLNSTAGLTTENSFRNSAAYIQGWLRALKNDPKMVVNASSQAEKATEYILNAE